MLSHHSLFLSSIINGRLSTISPIEIGTLVHRYPNRHAVFTLCLLIKLPISESDVSEYLVEGPSFLLVHYCARLCAAAHY